MKPESVTICPDLLLVTLVWRWRAISKDFTLKPEVWGEEDTESLLALLASLSTIFFSSEVEISSVGGL